jgi:D-amino-acid oxidase
MTEPQKEVIILGAGVTGLQIASSLLQTGNYSVTVVAQHFPGDYDIEYTSPWAGGFWRSHVGKGPEDAEVREWDKATYHEWKRLLVEMQGKVNWNRAEPLTRQVEKIVGLGLRKSLILFSTETFETKSDGSGLWWKDTVSHFSILTPPALQDVRICKNEKGGEQKLHFGLEFDTVCIDVPRYLSYLKENIEKLGAKLVKHKVSTDRGVESVVKELMFLDSSSSPSKPYGIVLATGLSSAKFLPMEEAEKLYPIRGQTVLVKGETTKAITHIFSSTSYSDELTYIVPRPGSGCTIIGGCKQAGNWEEAEDKELTKRILERAKGLVPQLLNNGDFEIVSVQVGRRPGREGGPRVELETENGLEGFDGKLVWAYGHSGAGYQNSVGSARKVVQLLED